MDGAGCSGDFNVRPCFGSGGSSSSGGGGGGSDDEPPDLDTTFETRRRALGALAPAPTNQSCMVANSPTTVAWSHPFKLPDGRIHDQRGNENKKCTYMKLNSLPVEP
jgi:hypothetical protein